LSPAARRETLLSRAEVLYWPKEQRVPDTEGRRGTLHVKCVVADSARMFVSSAKSDRAGDRLNMELGILIGGTRNPGDVEEHFTELVGRGVLRRMYIE
jgi:phosphatidylserine/phosphatidylglycerophosphate/cardiolipin synthase-like enzyme